MGILEEIRQKTFPINLQPLVEKEPEHIYDRWYLLTPAEITARRANLSSSNYKLLEVLRTYRLLEEALITTGLTKKQEELRALLLRGRQSRDMNDPESPIPIYELYGYDLHYAPVVFNRRTFRDPDTNSTSLMTCFLFHPHMPPNTEKPYLNKLLRGVNQSLRERNDPLIPLLPIANP